MGERIDKISYTKEYYKESFLPGDIRMDKTVLCNYGTNSLVDTVREYVDKNGETKTLKITRKLTEFVDNLSCQTKYNEAYINKFFEYLTKLIENYDEAFMDPDTDMKTRIYIEAKNARYYYDNSSYSDDDVYNQTMSFILNFNPLELLSNKMFLELSKK